MATITMLWILLTNVTPVLLIDIGQITVHPKHSSVFGVFHASLGSYAFNASVARAVCLQMGVTIADKAQVLTALQHGLETCRFGWIDEQVGVIPRVEQKLLCGQGKVGLITWRANLTTKFDVFCFNSTDFEAQAKMSTVPAYQTTTHTSRGRVHPETATPASRSVPPCSSCSTTSPQGLEDSMSRPGFTMGVVPTAVLIAAVFTILLVAAAVWCFRTGSLSRMQQECIEIQVHDSCSETDPEEPRPVGTNVQVEDGTDVRTTSRSEGRGEETY